MVPAFFVIPELVNDACFWELVAEPLKSFNDGSQLLAESAMVGIALVTADLVEIGKVAVDEQAVG